jgi:outer membrane receptor protein involved in Fe transport
MIAKIKWVIFWVNMGLITPVSATETSSLLQLSLEDLLNVKVISASKRNEVAEQAPATIYVVTEEQIKKLGLRDLKEVLALIPGMDISNNDFFLQGGQRGFIGSFAQSLILINGREMNNLIAGETFISNQFRTHNIKQVEVIAGPASALYGANAVGGLINIITKTADDMDGLEIQASYGAFDTREVSLLFGQTWGDLKLSGSVAYYQSQGADFSEFLSNTALASPKAENNAYRHLPNKYGYANPSSALPIHLSLEYQGYYAGLEYYRNDSGRGTASIQWDYHSSQDYRELAMPYLGYRWLNLLDDKLNIELEYRYYWEQFWGNHTESTSTIENPITGELLRDNVTLEDVHRFRGYYSNHNSRGSRKHWGLLSGNYRWNDTHYSSWGLDYVLSDIVSAAWSRTEGKHPALSEGNYQPAFKNYQSSIYLQDQSDWFNDKISLTLGARLVQHERYGRKLLPRYGVVYKPLEKTTFKALYGKSFREPTVFEINDNTAIRPMEMDTYELAWHQYWGEYVKNETVVFYNQAKNRITASDVLAFANEGSFNSQGLENRLSFKYQALTGFLNYTYMDEVIVENQGIKEMVYDIPRHKANVALIYDVNSQHSISLVGTYRSAINTDYQGDPYRIDPYWVWDGTWRITDINVLGHTLEMEWMLKNVFNTRYFHPEPRDAHILQHVQPERHLMWQVRGRF